MGLIERSKLIDALSDMYQSAEKRGQEANTDIKTKARAELCMATLVEMKLRIENLPSAESGLEEDSGSYDSLIPKVGRWTYHSNPSFGINPEDAYCSKCGFHVCVVDVEFDDYKYCPKCGVKMEDSNG